MRHLAELADESAGPETASRVDSIINECSYLMNYSTRIAYCVTIHAEDPEAKLIPMTVMVGCNLLQSGLQFAEGALWTLPG